MVIIPGLILQVALAAGADAGAPSLPTFEDSAALPPGGKELSAKELSKYRVECYGQDGPDEKRISVAVWKIWLAEGQALLAQGAIEPARDKLVRVLVRGGEQLEAVKSLILVHRAKGDQERVEGCQLLAGYLVRHPPAPAISAGKTKSKTKPKAEKKP
jgi:hypothetical protein